MNSSLRRFYFTLPHDLRRSLLKVLKPQKFYSLQALRKPGRPYSLKPFADQQCIFVHIPKTAGSSVNEALFSGRNGGHRTIAGYQLVYSKREFETYFKFTFVRNPWDRLLSAYHYVKHSSPRHYSYRWAAKHLSSYDTFDGFVRAWVTPDNVRRWHHFRPQVHYLCLPGSTTPALDFIGRFETLEEDFAHVCNELGVRVALPAVNVGRHGARDYRDYYTDDTRRIVAEVYKQDIELLGYTFEAHAPHLRAPHTYRGRLVRRPALRTSAPSSAEFQRSPRNDS